MVNFYKELANNPDASHDQLARNVGISRSMAYTYLDDLKTAWAVTSDDANFPRKLLLYHNHHLPAGQDPLTDDDIERLKPIMLSAINSKEAEAAAMSMDGAPSMAYNTVTDPDAGARGPEVGTNESLLRTILLKMRYVSPVTIDRFLENYRLNEEEFERRPETLVSYMNHMFGPSQGQAAFQIFKTTQGKYVDQGMATGQFTSGGMDPMLMAMMMGGGGGMSAMLPMLMQQNGGRMDPMIMAMLSQQSQREQQKKDQQDMMDRAMQLAMLKMVGSGMEDKNPLNPYLMGGGMGMPGWQIQEVLDSNGKVTGRTLVPATPGAGMANQSNPVVEIVLKNALERETMLMQQSMNSNKPITDLFLTMLGNFKSNSDPVAQLTNLRTAFPDLFERKQDPTSMNLDVYKLKFDTDLAMMSQKVELKKMDHQWKMEQLDRESQNENAKGWMQMIETFGEKLGAPLAGAVLGGMAQGGMGGPPGPQGPPGMLPGQATRTVPAGPPPEVAPPAPKPDIASSFIATPNPGPDPAVLAVAVQQEQQTRQMQSIMLAMQQEIERLRSDNQKIGAKLNQGGQRKTVDQNTIKKLPSSTLKEALVEFNHEQARSEEVGRMLQTELANRELRGSEDELDDFEDENEDNEEMIPEEDVNAHDAQGALDADERDDEPFPDESEGPSEGISTKGISSGDANNALNTENASMPSEIAGNLEAYEQNAKDLEDLDKDIE